jgi:hypothetical protein
VRSIETALGQTLVIVLLKTLLELNLIQGSDRFIEVSVVLRVGEVECGRGVVLEYPGEDGILVEVVVGPAAEPVQEHEIVEVGEAALLPLLSVFHVFKILYRIPDDPEPLDRQLQPAQEGREGALGVEGEEAGGAVPEEDLNGVAGDLVVLPVDDLVGLLQRNADLEALHRDDVVVGRAEFQVPELLLRSSGSSCENEGLLLDFVLAEVCAFSSDELAVVPLAR